MISKKKNEKEKRKSSFQVKIKSKARSLDFGREYKRIMLDFILIKIRDIFSNFNFEATNLNVYITFDLL